MTISEAAPQGAGILIVDDDPANLAALEAVLEPLGQRVVRATSGREALRHLLHQRFALILLDVRMRDMDGFEVASLIREKKTFQLGSVIQTGRKDGMQSMDESILGLVRGGVVSADDAAAHLSSRELLGSMLKTNPAAVPVPKLAA